MATRNRTTQNRSKRARLDAEHVIPAHYIDGPEVAEFLRSLDTRSVLKAQTLYSIGVALLRGNPNPNVAAFLAEYTYTTVDVGEVPVGFDVLGAAYQYLNSKRESLEMGAFYTGAAIANDFVAGLDFSAGQVIFDPSCGSGAFLFRSNAPASQLVGVDLDPIAVMIAKFNYFLKFPQAGPPKIYCADFFTWFVDHEGERYDYVIGNPPYGASSDGGAPSEYITSGESFSHFLELGYRLLRKGGVLRYLVPESLLNVKKHADVRAFILEYTNLRRIKRYRGKFSGVMSDTYLIELAHGKSKYVTWVGEGKIRIPKSIFGELQHKVFVELNERDVAIIEKVEDLRGTDLSGSAFGLGVVTGDNITKLLPRQSRGSEPIYTGKEVAKYRLLPAKNFLVFARANLQQVAPDEIYRAPVKLVYKTISKFLKVAVDETGALTTNSANIIIPTVTGWQAVEVAALLNSDLYSYLHLKLFGGVNKVAKENLSALPLPNLTRTQHARIRTLVGRVLSGGSDAVLQKYIHEDVFGLTSDEVAYIRRVVS